MARILVVEDNLPLAEGIAYNLEHEHHEARIAEDGRAGLDAVREWGPDLVILDLMLPELDGYQVLQRLRAGGDRTPVLILSARAEEADKVRGFRLDADQYVTKPFGLLELMERVKALLRRADALRGDEAAGPAPIAFGRVRIDTAAREVTRDDRVVPLTPKGYDLLLALVRREGAVVSRVDLLREVWGMAPDVMTRTVDSHMAELRKRLEDDPAEPRHLLTVWKVGYRFVR